MQLDIREVQSNSDLKAFVNFPFQLYKNDPFWVPPLIQDELTVFNPKKNPALEHCEIKYWLAYSDTKIVGRIAGVIHENESKESGLARFGWIDFEDDTVISEGLLAKAEEWAREKGLTGIQGPMGFTDMDFEGMLVEGFNSPATIATIYNYDYYPKHLEKLGFEKAADWVELRGDVPELSKRLIRKAEIITSRFGIEGVQLKSKKHAQSYGKELFEVLNSAYSELYGFHSLTQDQIQFYIDQYLGFVVKDLLSLVINKEGKLVGFAITMPSFTKAFQKAKGKLFPFGVLHILRALSKNDTADLYLIGVLPEYQKMGVTTLIFRDLIKAYNKRGIKRINTNQMLASNQKVLAQFNEYQENTEIYKRRRCYIKHFKK